jgi:hypothetical protein
VLRSDLACRRPLDLPASVLLGSLGHLAGNSNATLAHYLQVRLVRMSRMALMINAVFAS